MTSASHTRRRHLSTGVFFFHPRLPMCPLCFPVREFQRYDSCFVVSLWRIYGIIKGFQRYDSRFVVSLWENHGTGQNRNVGHSPESNLTIHFLLFPLRKTTKKHQIVRLVFFFKKINYFFQRNTNVTIWCFLVVFLRETATSES